MKKKEQIKIESNLIESLPIRFSRKPKRWNEREIINLNQGTLIVRYHKDLGFFIPFDMDVLMTTWALCRENNYTKKFPATVQKIREKLHLPKGGNKINNIVKSILRLALTGLEFNGSFYDLNTQKYISHKGFTVLEFNFISKKERTIRHVTMQEIFKMSYIELSTNVFESFLNGYFKYIDFDTYLSLPYGLSRMTFLYLEKRLGKKETYSENIEGILKSITHNENITSHDVRNFKFRNIPDFNKIYNVKVRGRILTITKKSRLRFIPQEPLTEHEEYVLNRACQECSRDDDFFKNTIKKYVRILGSQMVDGLIGEAKYYKPTDLSRYLIDLLKKDAASKQVGQGTRV